MPWLTFFGRTGGNVDGNHKLRPVFFRRADRYGLRQAAVYIFAVADNDGLEHVSESMQKRGRPVRHCRR